MEFEELTSKIIKCAYEVHKVIGSGFLESVYEKCMMIELAKLAVPAEAQQEIHVVYKGEVVGHFVADILVADEVIVEIKAVRQLAIAHEVQLVNYLAATGKAVGLLINFGPHGVEIKRKVRNLPGS